MRLEPRELLQSDYGLQVRRWVVPDDPTRIAAALVAHREGDVVDSARDEALRQNGLRLIRMRADQVDTLLAGLGAASLDVKAWYGQVLEWRTLQHYATGPSGAGIAVDGRVRRFAPGEVRLLVRSWTVQTEEGLYQNLELRPEFRRPVAPARRSWPAARRSYAEVFTSIDLELQLEPGLAYALTGESVDVEWPSFDADGDPPATTDASPPPPRVGPAVSTPVTVGELLFCGRGRPRSRGVLVFVPQLPPGPVTITEALPAGGEASP